MTSPENPVPFAVGDHVRKGRGRTIYRVISVHPDFAGGRAAVCRASAVKDPKRSCLTPFAELTKVEASA